MLVVQMSDPHFLPRGTLAHGAIDVAAHLDRAVDHVNALAPAVDAVLITGDLTADGDLAVYREMAAILDRLRAPLLPVIGNHDDREAMREVFADTGRLPAEGSLCYVVDDFAVRIVALDSAVEGEPWGRVGEEQLGWLDARLAEAPERPTLVALHHPPFVTGIGHMDWSMLRDPEDLAAVIARHPQVERVLAGHVHRTVHCRFAGTIAQIAPGVAHHIQLTLGSERGPWICEPPAVLLHYWDGAGLVTHVSPIGDYAPRGSFDDPHTASGGTAVS